jgi:hypothetical protein
MTRGIDQRWDEFLAGLRKAQAEQQQLRKRQAVQQRVAATHQRQARRPDRVAALRRKILGRHDS